MDRSQARHQDQTAYVNPSEENERADAAHPREQHFFADEISDPAAGPGNIEQGPPALEMRSLQLEQAGAGNDEEDNPTDPQQHPQLRVKQFRAAEPKQNYR